MADVIRKAQLARELGLSRARISQLCKSGLPTRADGKLDRAEALAWMARHRLSWRGGWAVRPKGSVPDPDFPRDEREAAEWLEQQFPDDL